MVGRAATALHFQNVVNQIDSYRRLIAQAERVGAESLAERLAARLAQAESRRSALALAAVQGRR